MKITITVECPCGRKATADAKRHIQENEGRVFEDYSVISDGFEGNPDFKMKQYHPDVLDIQCACGIEHELSV